MEYTEKEKKAITILDEFEFRRKTINYNRITVEDSQCAKTVLNLLEKQQKEIENYKKNMAIISEICIDESKLHITSKQAIKEVRNYLIC